MLHPEDILHLPYTPDLTQAGIAYACRSLAYTYNRMGGDAFERLRRIVVGIAVELALRRWLHAQEIPFDIRGETDFTQPDRYDIALGGRRCDVKSFLITQRSQIRQLRHEPEQLLQAQALVPLDQHRSAHHPYDLYLFAFVYALVTRHPREVRQALAAGQPCYWITPLPMEWSRPRLWAPLSAVLKSEQPTPLRLELGGQAEDRSFLSVTIDLPPRQRHLVEAPFFSLLYLHAPERPRGRVGLHSATHQTRHIITPYHWDNIWVYGLEIHLAGWMSWEEFNRKASVLPPGQRVLQYVQTRTRNLSLPVAQLHPLSQLLERVREWERERR